MYRLPLPLSGYNSLPAPLVVQATSWWEGVVVDTTETNLYLLDSYNPSIYSFNLASSTLTQLCTFPNEQVQSLTSLSVDFTQTPPVAYTTSEPFSWVYACDTSQTGQSITTPYYDDTQQTGNSLLFSGANLYTSGGVSTLYLLSKTESEGSSNIVLSTLVVSGTTPTTIGTTTPLVSSDSWYWPDNVVLSADGTVAYVMDGGYREGFVVTLPPYEYGFIYQCALTASPVQCTPCTPTTRCFCAAVWR